MNAFIMLDDSNILISFPNIDVIVSWNELEEGVLE